tara:strand:+ start:215 stop:547 length:333 start_codon:yes stop_codon:yes gene_type:complete
MIKVNTIPNPEAGLNVSKVAISLNSAAEFSMQFNVVGWGKFTNAEGDEVWGNTPLVSTLLKVDGDAWKNWTPDAAGSDAEYITGLALSALGLQVDNTVVPADPATPDDSE